MFAFVLAVLLGPIGLLYVNVLYGIILIQIAALLFPVPVPVPLTILILTLTWIFAAVDAPFAAISYNK